MSAERTTDFRPSAAIPALRRRAAALGVVRQFFAARDVLEVDTPALINAAVTDVNVHSAQVQLPGAEQRAFYLHTSPEYAMKRLLAAGSGDIYQLCHVFRGAERGALHNPEFTMIEWYRIGVSLDALMREVVELIAAIWQRPAAALRVERLTYRDAMLHEAGIDPFTVGLNDLQRQAQDLGLDACQAAESTRDELLDLIMGMKVGPALGGDGLTFVSHYPASQAALARLDPADNRVALRFELYASGAELANGFDELAAAADQRTRFVADQSERRRRGLYVPPIDEHFIAALESGLPPCVGVAVGFDRALMAALGATRIDDVIPFAIERA